MREWKMEWKQREHIAGVENAGVENARATKYGKPSEENTLKYQTKYQLIIKYQMKDGCRGFHVYLLPNATPLAAAATRTM